MVKSSNGRGEDGGVIRFSVSLPPDLSQQLDAMVAERAMPSRSQAIAEMIRAQLVDHHQRDDRTVMAGALTLVYRNSRPGLRTRITQIQRRYLKEVIGSQHVFLEHDHSLEVLLLQGPVAVLRALRREMLALKHVQTAELTLTAALLPPLH